MRVVRVVRTDLEFGEESVDVFGVTDANRTGGAINVITEKLLGEASYSLFQEVGSYAFYHPVMKTLFGMQRRVHETLPILDSPQPDPQLSWREAHRMGKRLMNQQADKYQFRILEERSLTITPSTDCSSTKCAVARRVAALSPDVGLVRRRRR